MHCPDLCQERWTHTILRFALLVGAGFVCQASGFAQQSDPFAPENELRQPAPSGPFAPEQALPEKTLSTATNLNKKAELSEQPARIGERTPVDDRIDFEIAMTPPVARRGDTVKLTITGTPRQGFHTYPISARTLEQSEGQLSTLNIENSPVLKPIGPVVETAWEEENIPGSGLLLIHKKKFTWTQELLVMPEAPPGKVAIRFHVEMQACDENTCVKGMPEFQAFLTISDVPPVPSPRAMSELPSAFTPIQIVAPETPQPAGSGQEGGMVPLLLFSIVSALLMLATPCVFPMIPITVSFFLKQSEKEHHHAFLAAALYSLTIIVVLAAAVLLLGGIIIKLANSAWINLGIGAMLIFFALSLFGMYEIELPSGLAQFTAAREGRGGYLGAVFMALTFTITSFTCTGPFLGPILAATKEMQLTTGKLIVASIAYSATFAAPFFVLALFPRLLRSLPKSGGWLNAVKVVMGFVELALALKFFANTDIAWHPGAPKFFNYETVLCAWIALSVGCSLYLFGLFRLPHDSPVESLGVVRMILATMFLGLALYMVPAFWRITPQGLIGRNLVALLPWDDKTVEKDLSWSRDYEQAWQEAVAQDKLIFIDFTGVNCVNCRANEYNVFTLPEVRKQLAQYVRVQLYTDNVPDRNLARAEAARQADRNSNFQKATFGDVSNPFYAIMRPVKGESAIVDGRLNGAMPGWTRKGKINEDQVADFERFLAIYQQQGLTQALGAARNTPALAAGTRMD